MRQKTALISVYNKDGIADFAKSLINLGWKIISSGGTAKHLMNVGISVTDVEEITGMPPILSHRVVTLHPKIHGGLLALDTPEHLAELEKYGIPWIDMICDDLYPLEEEIKNQKATRESVIEKTDVGGPAFIRSAAKGRRIVICEVSDRKKVIEWLKAGEPNKEEFINDLASKAEAVVARYCSISGEYHSRPARNASGIPASNASHSDAGWADAGGGKYKGIFGEKILECAYGENAYQKPASLYKNLLSKAGFDTKDELAIHNWQLVAGSPLSYNNICDLDRMIQTITHIGAGFEKNFGKVPYVVLGVKHGNACGVGVAEALLPQLPPAGGSKASAKIEVVDKMLLGDLRAIFGGSVMLNFSVDQKIAEELIHKYAGKGRRLLDIVAAPSFTPEAVEILSRKKGKCRLLANLAISKAGLPSLDMAKRFRYVRGGFLEQPNYTFVPDLIKNPASPVRVVLAENLAENVLRDVIIAWAIGCTSNSNTITIVKDGRLYGNGVGQQDRVGAAKLAIFRADEASTFSAIAENVDAGSLQKSLPQKVDLSGAVAYSDSFFPFSDAVEVLVNRGIKTIFSISGSVNDEKIIELCKQKGVNLIMLPDSEARGFYQH